jgi:hypothetical protein
VKNKKVYFVRFAVALALATLAGCGAVKKDEDAAVLRERSAQRWGLLIAHQADKAYDFLSPGYRQTKDRESYGKEMNARGVRWSKVHYESQECDADTCKVHLTVDYQVNLGGPAGNVKSSGFLVETWVKVDGHWWYLPSQLGPSKLGKEKES